MSRVLLVGERDRYDEADEGAARRLLLYSTKVYRYDSPEEQAEAQRDLLLKHWPVVERHLKHSLTYKHPLRQCTVAEAQEAQRAFRRLQHTPHLLTEEEVPLLWRIFQATEEYDRDDLLLVELETEN